MNRPKCNVVERPYIVTGIVKHNGTKVDIVTYAESQEKARLTESSWLDVTDVVEMA